MESVKQWLKDKGYDMNTQFSYEVGDDKVTINLDQALTGVIKRIKGNELFVIRKLEEMEKYVTSYGNPENRDKDITANFNDFFQELGMIEAYKNYNPLSWDQLATNQEMDVLFLKWWSKEKDLSEHQMLCDHDSQDTYSPDDGNFYNSVGHCKRCGCQMEDTADESQSIELVYKAWNHSKI